MHNPYASGASYQFWRRAISRVEPHLVNPAVNPRFRINPATKVATAGSCFAQHIARKIGSIGFNYFVPENGSHLQAAARTERQFGIFSARYGNIYTVGQLLQLYEEVFEGRVLNEKVWQRPDGRYVDPYRPQVVPAGYESADEVIAERENHIKAVRRVFEESELFIFTLGLTEAWRSAVDGAVFPIAPGVVASSFSHDLHRFHNFRVDEVTQDLDAFLTKIKLINRNLQVILTVSPVPLIATYENRHVLSSTIYSKSVLRVAAQAAVDRHSWVDYFPSYEIITAGSTGGLYFERDFREVSPVGVAHAMRCFVQSFAVGSDFSDSDATLLNVEAHQPHKISSGIICDEEAIDAIRP